MERLKGIDIPTAARPLAGTLLSIAATVVAILSRILYHIDVIIQRLATAIGLSKIPLAKGTPQNVYRNFNRIAICSITFVAFFFTRSYQHRIYSHSLEVPILGSSEKDLNLYYPPVGHSFSPNVPKYNVYSTYRPRTPIFIPFTRNNTMLVQAVLSYISVGWPRADIIIVDNSGTMDSNVRGHLSGGNPFFLDYNLFRRRYGVSIIQTPTLLNFAQLQNFMLRVAIMRDWPYYFWSHMDVVVLSAEESRPYKSFYHRVVDILDSSHLSTSKMRLPVSEFENEDVERAGLPSLRRKEVFMGSFDRLRRTNPKYQAKARRNLRKRSPGSNWAVKFFDFDNLALINVEAWRKIGQWDVFIPYYNTDCDFYSRMVLRGFKREDVQAGHMYDVAAVVSDPEERFFPGSSQNSRDRWGIGPEGPEPAGGSLNSWRYRWLKSELNELMERKSNNTSGRNTWQSGEGTNLNRKNPEPWSYDPKAFQAAWWATADYGRGMYVKKWGTLECELKNANKTVEDAWLLEHVKEGSDEAEARMTAEDHWMSVLDEGPIR